MHLVPALPRQSRIESALHLTDGFLPAIFKAIPPCCVLCLGAVRERKTKCDDWNPSSEIDYLSAFVCCSGCYETAYGTCGGTKVSR